MNIENFNKQYTVNQLEKDLEEFYPEYSGHLIVDLDFKINEASGDVQYDATLEDEFKIISIVNNGVRIKAIERDKVKLTIEYRETKLNNNGDK